MHMYTTGISDEMCFCTLTIPNMEYGFGSHNITFQGVLNGQIRGSTTSRFLVTDSKHNIFMLSHLIDKIRNILFRIIYWVLIKTYI